MLNETVLNAHSSVLPLLPFWHHQSLTPHSTPLNRYIPGHITCDYKQSFGRARLKIHYDNYNPDSLLSKAPSPPSLTLIRSLSLPLALFSPNQRLLHFHYPPPPKPPQPPPPNTPLEPSNQTNTLPHTTFTTFHRTKQKTSLFSIQSKANEMKTKGRIAALLCVKGFFFTCVCVYVGYVLEKSVTREQNESTPSLLPSHFSRPACLPPSPSFLTHSTKTNQPSFSAGV